MMPHGSKPYTATVPTTPNVCPHKDELVEEILARLEMEEADAKKPAAK